MRRAAAVLSALLVLTTACAEASDETVRSPQGVIEEPGRLGIVHLRPGDCLRDPLADQVAALVGVPCSRAHRAQVVAIGESDDAREWLSQRVRHPRTEPRSG